MFRWLTAYHFVCRTSRKLKKKGAGKKVSYEQLEAKVAFLEASLVAANRSLGAVYMDDMISWPLRR
jgi:hypothetical protein